MLSPVQKREPRQPGLCSLLERLRVGRSAGAGRALLAEVRQAGPVSRYAVAVRLRRAFDRLACIVLNGRFSYRHDPSLRSTRPARYYRRGVLHCAGFAIIAHVLVLVVGVVRLLRRSSAVPPGPFFLRRPRSLFFIWFNVAWMTFVADAIEVGENNRFRFVTDPLVFAFLAALAADRLGCGRSLRSGIQQ